jgi:alpha-tubulin suppressor-like RCC1 family protein
VQCWGSGPLGIDPPGVRSTPVAVSGITNAVAISSSSWDACALLADGTVKCWGEGSTCQIGFQINGACTSSIHPVAIAGLTDAVAISAGDDHTCAILSTGKMRCWGDNTYGELGTGSTSPRESVTPLDVNGPSTFVGVATANHLTCGVLQDGEILCWGKDVSGLAPVANVTSAVAISMQFQHSCALQSDGEVQCWGVNTSGELGDGSTTSSATPVKVLGLTTATAIAVGVDHTCALLTDGTARCWGGNGAGELGNGSMTSSSVPVPVSPF